MNGPEHKSRYRKHMPLVLILLIISLLIAVPVLADYLGPDRRTVTLVKVRDPGNDVWTLKNDNPPPGYLDTCLIIHTCAEHPSIDRQLALCGWIAESSGCEKAYKYEEQEVILPEATINSNLANCSLTSGWCTSSPTLNLVGNEPLAGESILAVEGTYNGATFACGGSTCNVSMGEGGSAFTFWAISSYGDSSRMGNASAQVDTRPPTVSGSLSGAVGDNGWWVSQPSLSATAGDPSPGSGLASFTYSLDGGGWTSYGGPITIPEGGHEARLRAVDGAGHVATSTQTVKVDTKGPDTSITGAGGLDGSWAKGTLGLSGASQDAISGVARIEISLDGGGSWKGLSVGSGGSWTYSWDTRTVVNGSYRILVRARDVAGNLGGSVGVTVRVDNAPPHISIPKQWMVWEAARLVVEDQGIGIGRVTVTIEGGSYGQRTYSYEGAGAVPNSIRWDRYFGSTSARIGEYLVMVEAWDRVGNRGTASGMVVVPAPEVTPTAVAVIEPIIESAELLITGGEEKPVTAPEPTPTREIVMVPLVLDQGAEDEESVIAPSLSPLSIGTGENAALWGPAAVGLAAVATAYAMSRRKEREEREQAKLERKRRDAARWAKRAAMIDARLAANRRAAQIRAEAKVALEAEVRREALDLQRLEQMERLLEGGFAEILSTGSLQDQTQTEIPTLTESEPGVQQTEMDGATRAELNRIQYWASIFRNRLSGKKTDQEATSGSTPTPIPTPTPTPTLEEEPFVEKVVDQATSPEGIFDAVTDEVAIDAMKGAQDLPDLVISLPILRGFGLDDAGPLILRIDTSKLTRAVGRLLGDFSVPALAVAGAGLSVGPNLYQNIDEGAPGYETTSDFLIDGGIFIISEAAGWLLGLLAGAVNPVAGVVVKLGVDAFVGAKLEEIVDRNNTREALSQGLKQFMEINIEYNEEFYKNQQLLEEVYRVPTPSAPTATSTPEPPLSKDPTYAQPEEDSSSTSTPSPTESIEKGTPPITQTPPPKSDPHDG